MSRRGLYDQLRRHMVCDYDEAGSIGKRYRRQDEMVPLLRHLRLRFLEDKAVTVRDRDMEQVRLPIADLVAICRSGYSSGMDLGLSQ